MGNKNSASAGFDTARKVVERRSVVAPPIFKPPPNSLSLQFKVNAEDLEKIKDVSKINISTRFESVINY